MSRVEAWMPICLLAYFLYAWLWLDPACEWQAQGAVFLTSRTFFIEHCRYPGGLIDYAAGFIFQFFRWAWLGALISTLVAGGLCLALSRLLARSGSRGRLLVPILATILLLSIQSNYAYPWLGPTLSLLIAIAGAAFYPGGARLVPSPDLQKPQSNPARSTSHWRFLFFCLSCLPLYYLLAGGFLPYVLLCALHEAAMLRRPCQGLTSAVIGAAIPYVAANAVFIMTLEDAYAYLTPLAGLPSAPWTAQLLFFLAPCLPILARLLQESEAGQLDRPSAVDSSAPVPHSARQATHPMRHASGKQSRAHPNISIATRFRSSLSFFATRASHPAVWLVLGGAWLACSFDYQARRLLQVEYYAQQQQWDRVLAAAAGLRSAIPAAVCDTDWALAHTGGLLESMFHYPQKYGLNFWFDLRPGMDNKKLLRASDLLFELGHVSRAERMAGESLELNGYQPGALKRLFQVSVLKGDAGSALPFLNLLGQTLGHRAEAQRYRRDLEGDAQLTQDPDLRRVRSVMVTRDHVGALTDDVLLLVSLRQNPRNRMAVEYLLAFYLLNRQLDKLEQNLERLDALNLAEIPRHVQEALVLLQGLHPEKNLNLRGPTLSRSCRERYHAFQTALSRYRAQPTAGEAPLAAEFGDTYWYYYIYGQSGRVIPQVVRPKTAGN